MASETRPGCWLSHGDALEWEFPAGPSRERGRDLFGFARGGAAGRLELSLFLPGEPADREDRLALGAEPFRRSVGVGFLVAEPSPPREAGPASDRSTVVPSRSPRRARLFLTEPFFSVPHGDGPRTIVLFLIDTLRADRVSGYGYALPTTPRLDRFFRDGLRAETCLPPANWTLPSHASLFTSLSVARHGVGRYGHHLPENMPTLAETFARAGYRTLAVTGGGLRRCGVRPGARVRPIRGRGRFGLVFGGQGPLDARGAPRRASLPLLPHVPGPRLRPGRARRSAALPRLRRPRPRLAGEHRRARSGNTPPTRACRPGTGHATTPPCEAWTMDSDGSSRGSKRAAASSGPRAHDVRPRRVALRPFPRAGVPSPGSREPVSLRGGAARAARGSSALVTGVAGVIPGNTTLLDVAPTLLAAAGVRSPASFEGRSLLVGPPSRGPDRRDGGAPRSMLSRCARGAGRSSGARARPRTPGSTEVPSSSCRRRSASTSPAIRGKRARSPASPRRARGCAIAWTATSRRACRTPSSCGCPPEPPGSRPRTAVDSSVGARRAACRAHFRPRLASRARAARHGHGGPILHRRAPVWLAFETARTARAPWRSRSPGSKRPVTAGGAERRAGAYRWQELTWSSGRPLPAGAGALHDAPVGRGSPPLRRRCQADVIGRLLSLGYLRGLPPVAPERPAAPPGPRRQPFSLPAR